MAKVRQFNESWNVSYNARDKNTSEDILSLSMNWENPDTELLTKNLNIWLDAIGVSLKVVEKK